MCTRLCPSCYAARNCTLLSNGLLFTAAPEKTCDKEEWTETIGIKDGNFPSSKPELMVATQTSPPLSGLTSRKQRKDQKRVEIKQLQILKFFCFATGCHPSSMHRSASQEYSVESKGRETAPEVQKFAPPEISLACRLPTVSTPLLTIWRIILNGDYNIY